MTDADYDSGPEITRESELEELRAERDVLRAELVEMTRVKDRAYEVRDRCVSLIAAMATRLGYLVGTSSHPSDDAVWDPEWRTIVFVELPHEQQLSWHVHERECTWFRRLKPYPYPWDGHTTEEKYARIEHYVNGGAP